MVLKRLNGRDGARDGGASARDRDDVRPRIGTDR